MSEQRNLQVAHDPQIEGLVAIENIDRVLQARYPDATNEEIATFRNNIFDYVANNLSDNFDIAMIHTEEGKTILRVLRFHEVEGK